MTTVSVKADKNVVIISGTGHSQAVDAGKTADIPLTMLEDALRAGCTLVGVVEAEAPTNVRPADEDFKKELFAVVSAMIEQGDKTDFTSLGVPRVAAVVSRIGYAVNGNEIEDVFNNISALNEMAE